MNTTKRHFPGMTQTRQISADDPLRLDLYNAECLAQGPRQLSLRKLWIAFDPNDHSRRHARGYYVLYTQSGRIHARQFGLTELTQARRCFQVMSLRFQQAVSDAPG